MKIGPNEKHEEAHIRGHVNILPGFFATAITSINIACP